MLLFLIVFIRLSAVLEHLCINEEHNFFGNIRYMVSGAFQLTEYTDKIQTGKHAFRMFFHIAGKNGGSPGIDFIQKIILRKNLCCQFDTFLIQGTFCQFEHRGHLPLHLLQTQMFQ